MKEINREIPSDFDITFFVPCLNEAGNIGPTIQNIVAVMREFRFSFEILVFDDHSEDSSRDEVRQMIASHRAANIRLIENNRRFGLARNYCDGAYEARGRHYMLVNGDNAEPPSAIRAIVKELGRADMIIPVFVLGDNRTLSRRVISRTFTRIVNLISGNQIKYYNGPVLHRRFNVMRWHADSDGFAYQAEIITRLLQEGATYLEVVIENTDRQLGSSSALTLKNFLAISHSLFQISMRRLRSFLYYQNRGSKNLGDQNLSVPATEKN